MEDRVQNEIDRADALRQFIRDHDRSQLTISEDGTISLRIDIVIKGSQYDMLEYSERWWAWARFCDWIEYGDYSRK